jgi:hypothetical protein
MTPELIDKLIAAAGYYGAACLAFNGLATVVSAFVARTPGHSDDEHIEKIYASKVYKAFAWVFSWGDYIAEAIGKLKSK